MLTITPIDFHADNVDNRPRARLHQRLDAEARSRGRRSHDRCARPLPGEFMGSVFSMMTPMRIDDEIQPRSLGSRGRSQEVPQFSANGEMDRGQAASSGRSREAMAKGSLSGQQALRQQLVLGGRQVDLKTVDLARPERYVKDDHIIPPATSQALAEKSGLKRITPSSRCRAATSGCSSAAKSQGLFAPGIADWFSAHQGKT